MRVELRAEKVARAAGVSQQLLDSDFSGDILVGIVGEVFADGIAERDFSGLHELKNRDGGEHFVHRADAKFSVERIGDFLFAIGHAICAGENRFTVFGQEARRRRTCRPRSPFPALRGAPRSNRSGLSAGARIQEDGPWLVFRDA